MQRVSLEVSPRDLKEKDVKRNLNQLRKSGWVPANLYGDGKPENIVVNTKEFLKAIKNKAGANALFNVKLGDTVTLTVIKEIQKHIFTQLPIHIDFQRINMKKHLDVNIPVHTIGEAPGVKNDGGILEHITREIRVRCLPDDIPASIDIDVSAMGLGAGVKVKDLAPIKGVEIMTSSDTILINIIAPKVEEVKVDETATGATPEVIAKGKKDEEGAAAGAKPAAGGKAGAAAPAAKGKDEKKK